MSKFEGLGRSQAASIGAGYGDQAQASASLSAEIVASALSSHAPGRRVKILLDEEEAAAAYGVSRRTFVSLRQQGLIPAPIILGPRLLRWSLTELLAAVETLPRQTTREQPESLLRAKIDRLKGITQ